MTSSIHFVKVAEHNLKDYESLSFSAVSSRIVAGSKLKFGTEKYTYKTLLP